MKNYIIATIFSIAAFSINTRAQVKIAVPEVATPELAQLREEQKKTIIAGYLAMKNSLVISDSKKTATSASEFSAAIGKFKFKKLTLDNMNAATAARKSIKELADSIAVAPSINVQRKLMEKLSVQFWLIIDKVKPADMRLYQQKCPMMGVTWISNDKKIENPYYPKNMLSCGEVIEEK
ncbi:DUF3347 domain-containing protein [Pedobacter sp. CFBP9032]|uniref:DUF3347 domain-containing protein n=1 Tax=Pedobacter sp. CFBP9032 TaxID=3096539 RepID=UPI002A6B7E7A|nr:DUF3347 domain-containing protein [Pedobacter sp. CFBP9032]MDY0904694.1 DUF3347 domain-containing protein [Pedobacter sp. CFBP9032]